MTLSADPNVLLLLYALHEEPVGEIASTAVEKVDNGRVVGQVLPTNNHRYVFLFKGVTAKETITPDEDEADSRRVLDKFYSGAELRVYRNWPVDITPWAIPTSLENNTNNLDGYSDLVVLEVGDKEYIWYDNVLQRFSFEIEGVEVS
jgi:hypothetical protein